MRRAIESRPTCPTAVESSTCAAFESYRWPRRSWRSVGLEGEAIESQFVPGGLKRRV